MQSLFSERPTFSLVAKALQKYPKSSKQKQARTLSYEAVSNSVVIRLPEVNKEESKSPYRCRFSLKESIGVNTDPSSPQWLKVQPFQPLNSNVPQVDVSYKLMPPLVKSKPPLPRQVKRTLSSSSIRLKGKLNASFDYRPRDRQEKQVKSLAEVLDLKSERRRRISRLSNYR